MKPKSTGEKRNKLQFRNLSIHQRLPLLICILLLTLIITCILVSYIGVRKAALKVGQDRLQSLTEQLSTMLSNNRRTFVASTFTAANKPAVRAYLVSEGKDSAKEASKIIEDLRKDTASVEVELRNSLRISMIKSVNKDFEIRFQVDSILYNFFLQDKTDSGGVGELFAIDSTIFYPVMTPVIEKKKPIGYLIRWRKMTTTTQALEQFSKLLGSGARLYVGNNDGRLWTDLRVPIYAPELMNPTKGVFQFRTSGKNVMASIHPFASGTGLVAIELSMDKLLEPANRFLRWIIFVGILLTAAGMYFAWIMSRRITRPLKTLSEATTAIAAGDYHVTVDENRGDEFGELARAFNKMAMEVQNAQQHLEKKILERTAQIESANQALESFSYSVSHDLRAPLRAISGYSNILREEYGKGLDAEANRLTEKIISHAKMMGQLIDDLISFSRVGRKELQFHPIDMRKLVDTCLDELLQQEQKNKIDIQIKDLPSCPGDSNLIKQVWINLIGNALKYSAKKNYPAIEIGSDKGEESNIYYIRDNGVGFDMQYAHKLFGVFQRLHGQKEFDGTGVGLALAKRIITQHRGEIWAKAHPGEGATFYFSLPRTPEQKDQPINQAI